jgi:triosephosphate isomerase
MAKPLIIGNWKMHKTLSEAVAYVQTVGDALHHLDGVDIVLCPAYPAVGLLDGLLRGTRVALGAQDVAAWDEGSYTGEVSAKMLAGHCHYVIVGHSERRRLLGETQDMISEKIQRAHEAGLQPVVCVSQEAEVDALVPLKSSIQTWIIAFEPLEAIGTGKPSDPATVAAFNTMVRKKLGRGTRVIYGGSVDAGNVRAYLAVSDGVLPGKASLDPQGFLALCQAAVA